MLNEAYKNQVINDLNKIDRAYMAVFNRAVKDMERLQSTRMIAVRIIQNVERYVVSIANRPRDFDMKIGQIKIGYINFTDVSFRINQR